jgi:hypothetical protein
MKIGYELVVGLPASYNTFRGKVIRIKVEKSGLFSRLGTNQDFFDMDVSAYSLRICPMCPPLKNGKDGKPRPPKMEMMHDNDRFCKKCKKAGKAEIPLTYSISTAK